MSSARTDTLAPQNLWQSWILPLAALAVLKIGGPFIPIPNVVVSGIAAIVFTFAYVGAVVAFVLAVARYELPLKVLLVGAALCAGAWGLTQFGAGPWVDGWMDTNAQLGTLPTTPQLLLTLYTSALQDFALLGAATFVGCIIAKMIRHPNLIGPIGVMVALIDIWGVLFGGIVSQMLSNKATQPIAQKAMTHGPHLGAINAANPKFSIPLPAIGVGDFLFLALFLAALVNFRMNWRLSAQIMWVAVSLALLAIVQPFLPVPALPGLLFLGLGAVAPNLKFFSFTRDEKFALLWAGGFVLILTGALYLGFKHALPS